MNYIIVSTSKCKYQYWQLKLLYWSIRKVQQEGKILFLVSADLPHKNEGLDWEFDAEVELVELPDWATEWKTKHDDWWGGIPNKYESFNWVASQYPFNDADNLLFLDPDMIFLKKVNLKPKENEIIGQKWMNYSPLKGWEQYSMAKQAFMYPFAIRFSTLKLISPDFKKFCFIIRKDFKKWESDMWALDYAAKNNKVTISLKENLGRCTVWQKDGDQKISPLVHFPNVVYSAAQEKLFFKQDYTFKRDQKFDIQQARNLVDKMLLINISQERTDFVYHLKWNFNSIFKFYTGEAGYLYIKPWPGGFNNIRMSLELGVCLAYLTNRTIVLPSTYQMYLLKGKSNISDFFALDRIGVKIITLEVLCEKLNLECNENAVKKKSKVLAYNSVRHVMNFEKVPIPKKILKNRKELRSDDFFDDSEVIYLDQKLLGSFEQSIHSSYKIELKKLIAKHVVYRSDIFDLAWQFINALGDQDYYAIHIRRNDFQYKDLFISSEKILENLNGIVPLHTRLYIATDHKEKGFFKIIEENYEVIYYDTLEKTLKLPSFNVNWIPIVEQFICTRALKFIGMPLSTLSSYIFRMRGYMDDIEDKNYYINGHPFNLKKQCDFIEEKNFHANWSREYKSIWKFEAQEIFISIASFRDTELFSTIENLLAEASNPRRLTIGVHLQDKEKVYKELQKKEIPNLKILFTPYADSKGVVWARNRIRRELFLDEDFFLQVDSHSRFKENWDNILINQYESIEEEKVVLSTYPNNYDIGDETKDYLNLKRNSPLKIKQFLTTGPHDNRLRPRNLGPLKDYETVSTRWCAAGFVFARGEWVRDVVFPDNIKFNGEEDLMTNLSFLKGYNLKLTSEACIWHNYNFKNKNTGKRYKEFNKNKINDKSVQIVNKLLFGKRYKRSIVELEHFLDFKFKIPSHQSTIFVSIASYRDSEIRATIEDCIKKAKHPSLLHFGVCLQYDEKGMQTNENCIDDLINRQNIKVEKVYYKEAKGLGWARRVAQDLYNNESFILQIDAHSRFIDDWDSIIVQDFQNLINSGVTKPILTFRPPSYQRDQANSMDFNFNNLSKIDTLNVPEILNVTEDFCLEYSAQNEQKTNFKNIGVSIVETSFVFSNGLWADEIKYDSDYYFMGEEVAITLRSYTNGYDFFLPSQIVAWHGQGNERKHYLGLSQNEVLMYHSNSLAKLKKLITAKVSNELGLGAKRSLADFESFSGLSFQDGKVEKPL